MQARGVELDPKKTGLLKRMKQNILILIPLVITSLIVMVIFLMLWI